MTTKAEIDAGYAAFKRIYEETFKRPPEFNDQGEQTLRRLDMFQVIRAALEAAEKVRGQTTS